MKVKVPLLKRSLYKRTYKGLGSILKLSGKSAVIETLQEINKKDPMFISYYFVTSDLEDRSSNTSDIRIAILKMPEFILTDDCLEDEGHYRKADYIKARAKVLPKEKIVELIKSQYPVYKFVIEKRPVYENGVRTNAEPVLVENEKGAIRHAITATAKDFVDFYGKDFKYLHAEVCKDIEEYKEKLKEEKKTKEIQEQERNKKIVNDIRKDIASQF